MKLTSIKSVTLRVKNLNEMKSFYQRVLGMTILSENNDLATLGTKNKVLLTLKHSDDYTEPKEPVAGLYHVAYLLPERKYLASFLSHLIDTRTPIEGASDHGVSEAVYLRDPEWNGIEVYVDRPKDKWPMKNGQVDMFTDAMDIADIMTLKIPYEGLPDQTLIGHVHQHVSDIQNHLDYYQNGLGMDLMLQYGASASFLSYNGYHHHIGMNVWKGKGIAAPLRTDYGLDAVTLMYDASDLALIVKQLMNHQYPVMKQNDTWITEDPSGHRYLLVSN